MVIGGGKLALSGDEARKAFEPVLDEVRKSIRRQVRDMLASKAFKAVVIEGGLITRFC